MVRILNDYIEDIIRINIIIEYNMVTVHKLTKDGETIFPATITDAVVHPQTRKTLTSMIKDYNVSELFPTEGIDGGNTYDLALAIQMLGTHLTSAQKTGGIKLTFISSTNNGCEIYFLAKNEWSNNVMDWNKIDLNNEFSNLSLEAQAAGVFLGSNYFFLETLGNFYVNNGVITPLSAQVCKYFKVIKGQKFGIEFSGTVGIRWGLFNETPKNGDTTTIYGIFSQSTTLIAQQTGYFVFSYLTSLQDLYIVSYSKIEDIEKEVNDEKTTMYKIYSSVLDYTTLEKSYILDGKVTQIAPQNTYFTPYLNKGTKILIKIRVSESSTAVRWGAFSTIPTIGSQAFDYGIEVIVDTTADYEFRHEATQNEYFAISILTANLVSLSFETEGILNYVSDSIDVIYPQVSQNTADINKLVSQVGVGIFPIVMERGFWSMASLNVGDTFNPDSPRDFGYSYKCSKLSCNGGDKFTINSSFSTNTGLYAFTDSNNIVLDVRNEGPYTVKDEKIIAPTNAAYFYLNDGSDSTSYAGEEDNIQILQKEINGLISKDNLGNISSTFSLSSSASKTLDIIYVRKNSRMSLKVGSFTSFRFGLGYNSFQGYWIEVNSSTVSVYDYVSSARLITSYSHGLNTSSGVEVSIVAGDDTASIILIDSFGGLSKKDDVNWWGGGAAFVTNLGTGTIEGSITYFPGDITKKIWLFGDSYLTYNSNERWLYYMIDWNLKNWLANHLPGINSANSIINFDNLVKLGNPKYVVWCLGMNDGTDTNISTPSNSWLSAIKHIISYCESSSIIPILTTIPSVPGINHEGKNNYVRNSGYRYIDFSKAVNAQPNGNWTTGLLSTDKVHPTLAGAKVLASQVLIDFPEIMVEQN